MKNNNAATKYESEHDEGKLPHNCSLNKSIIKKIFYSKYVLVFFSFFQGVHPNSNNILQQRLTQQRMGVPTTLPMHTQNQAPQGMMRVNRMPMQHGPRPGMPMGGPGPNQNPAIYSINPSPGSMVQVSSPAMIQMPGQSPMGGGHFVPSPQQQQPGGPAGAGVPSPGGPRMSMAPSPQSTSIRTPQNNADNAPQTPEEQAYLDKVRQLGKYIEPLRKMIAKIGNEDQEKLKKMTKLMDILSNPNKRLAYDVLLRCESVLKHMISDDPNESSSGLLHDSSSNINPLLDSVSLYFININDNHKENETKNK